MLINSNTNNYQSKQSFGAKVKAEYIEDSIKGIFGMGLVAKAKPIIGDLADNKVIFRVADKDGFVMEPCIDIIAETKHEGKMYQGKFHAPGDFFSDLVNNAKEALANMNRNISKGWDVKAQKEYESSII